MPFGMVTSPTIFSRMMDSLLLGTEGHSNAYFDDTSVFSDQWDLHVDHLRDIFGHIRKAYLTVRPKKTHNYRILENCSSGTHCGWETGAASA